MKTEDYEKQTMLKQNSFWAIWSLLSVGELVKDTCSLVWNSFFAIITLPLWIFPGLIINSFSVPSALKQTNGLGGNGFKFWYYSIINIVLIVIGYGWLIVDHMKFGDNIFKIIGLSYFRGITIILVGIILLLITLGISWIVDQLKDKYTKWKYNNYVCKEKQTPVLKTFFHNLKKKHCSLINWK